MKTILSEYQVEEIEKLVKENCDRVLDEEEPKVLDVIVYVHEALGDTLSDLLMHHKLFLCVCVAHESEIHQDRAIELLKKTFPLAVDEDWLDVYWKLYR